MSENGCKFWILDKERVRSTGTMPPFSGYISVENTLKKTSDHLRSRNGIQVYIFIILGLHYKKI